MLLNDILEAIEKTSRYVGGMSFDSFIHDEKTVDAVVRNIEIIGEAANRLPDEFKESHSDIEWYKVVGLRNRVVHEYFGIDLDIIWQILHRDLPGLQAHIKRVRS
ncbi:MAG TPA: DUF86 domain-containing protein [Sedimentisphaerales bacterium]|nr:DUF86 domain-containing protein [Sedimentisphaerales bacterium]HNU29099.1 DUF86 domain-containing protein [Sedimentisphaerales bacterium]